MAMALAMAGVLAITLGVFVYSIRRRTKLIMTNRDEHRWDNFWKRIDGLITIMIGQKKLFKLPLAGLMHALIFWGFCILLIRSMSLIGSAFIEGWTLFWFWEGLEHFYTFAKDITELVVLVMIIFAVFRRAVIKPKRITSSADAYGVLGMIGFLMISDFLMDGGLFVSHGLVTAGAAATGEAAYAPIGAMVARMYLAFGMETGGSGSAIIYQVFYWLHVGTLFFFLNYLPYSKHCHVLTVLFNVFFRNLKPGYALKPIEDIEGEFEKEEPRLGVNRIEQFNWKQLLDVYTCVECGRCTLNCPADLSGKPLSPKKAMEDLKHHLVDREWEILGKKKPEVEPMEDRRLLETVGEDVIWSCTTCRSCEENCPVMNEYVDKFVDMRRYLVMMESNFPKELTNTFKNLENKSNPWGLPLGDRDKWCADMDIKKMGELEDPSSVEYLYFVGCAGAYDDRSVKVAKALVEILDTAGVSFGILGKEEGCTGDTARRLGNEYLFQIQAQTNVEVFNAYGVKKIIVTCPHCYQTIANEYPQFGGNYEVVHHTELIRDLIQSGKIKLEGQLAKKLVYHDSCYLGRYNDIYDAPRDVIKSINGTSIVEPERTREGGFCCGAGGGWAWMEEHGDRMNLMRTDQLLETNPETVATACPFCLMMLKDGVADRGKDEEIPVLDIAEIVRDAMKPTVVPQ